MQMGGPLALLDNLRNDYPGLPPGLGKHRAFGPEKQIRPEGLSVSYARILEITCGLSTPVSLASSPWCL